MTEKQEQITLIKRAAYNAITRDYLFAIPNGGMRHPIEAHNLKLQGVKAGIPDLMLAYPSNNYHGLFIELKRNSPRKGLISAEQAIWLHRLQNAGYLATVAYGWEDAWKIITNYLQPVTQKILDTECNA